MYNSITNAVSLKERNTGNDPQPLEITSDHLRKWNKLIDFAKEKGYAGNRELDHDPMLRKKIFDEFNKANPKDAIPISMVEPLQKEIQSYKTQALENIRKYPDSYKGDPNAFMEGISQVDGIFGQKTSQWKFPDHYILDKDKNQLARVGFAPKADLKTLMH